MRSTARVLYVAALASATLGFAASAALADPAAEVSPSTVSPGGSVTVSVSCEATGGQAPATIDATSDAFDEGTVQLQRVPGNDAETAGPAYRGAARISSAEDFAADGPAEAGADSAWTVDGTCPGAPGGKGKPWRATFQGNHGEGGVEGDGGGGAGGVDGSGVGSGVGGVVGGGGGGDVGGSGVVGGGGVGDGGVVGGGESRPCPGRNTDSCGSAPVQHGVEAGEGGTFSDSVPALVIGGILIAGAMGAAAYRLWHRGTVLRG
ncbi:hypothetical protein [Streptomyces sp. NBC_00847]|uniref:hypothetical protein n=1 Tax=Streptomyces sp. NBC_00847 TaxID=2975850 RepID=UPI002259A403|nr:hypothetical protein [Streptomyces sp. NBC_00847]MCX4885008.1 hypothetical protein [Streptomyces sp. NBC_00847]